MYTHVTQSVLVNENANVQIKISAAVCPFLPCTPSEDLDLSDNLHKRNYKMVRQFDVWRT